MVGFHEENPDPGLVLEVRRRVNALAATQPGPVLVHCRCGGGRTAVYISVDFCLHQLHAEDRVDVFNTVLHLRRFRRGMVRTLSQYTQIYKAVAMYLQCGVTVHPALTLPATVHVHYHLGEDAKHLRLEKEFHTLESIVPRLSIGDCASGHRVENRSKSRDIMMLPPECARPYLTTADCGDSGTDFINAVYVDGYHFENAFMVTQWPMRRTIADLWRLLFDFKITSLVLMNDIRKFSRKYSRFWPKEIDQVVSYGPISVRYLCCERKSSLIVRTFTIRKVLNTLVGCEMRIDELVVKMFQVLGQPGEVNGHDHHHPHGPRLHRNISSSRHGDSDRKGWGDSDDHHEGTGRRHRARSSYAAAQGQRKGRGHMNQWSESVLSCIEQVYEWQRRAGSRQPVCVVSKDGSSRVGAFCAIAVACDQARVEKEVDVFNAVRLVRKNRPQLVPNIEEYQFIYHFMADFITQSNSKPEIVISEPEVMPDCFSPSLALSPLAPVVRSHCGGISVAAPGKIFNPTQLSSAGDKGHEPCKSSGFTVHATPFHTTPQTNKDCGSKNNFSLTETHVQTYDNGGRKPNARPSQNQSITQRSCPTECYDNLKVNSAKELETFAVTSQCSVSESRSNDYNLQRNIVDSKHYPKNSTQFVYSNQYQMPINDIQRVCLAADDSCKNAFSESSSFVRPKPSCTCYLNVETCYGRCPFDKSISCVGSNYTNYLCSEMDGCQHKIENYNSDHKQFHMSLSQSHISSQPHPPQGSPWFSHARSKPNTPQRKVSWPPPAALSPGQYINSSSPLENPAVVSSTMQSRFFPPPVPPPTPCLRLSQLSTCTNSTSFYSCHSELSVAMVNSSCGHTSEFSSSKQLHHCSYCSKNVPLKSASQITHYSLLPSSSSGQPVKDCQCSSHDIQHNSETGDPNVYHQFPYFVSSKTHHLDVPKTNRSEIKANMHYLSSLAHQKAVYSKDTSAAKSTRNTHPKAESNHDIIGHQQTMRVCVPSGGGDPTDFKLIHASYASLDESVCSSLDNSIRPRSETNGNALNHCLQKFGADAHNNNSNHFAHASTMQEKRPSSSALVIRRLSKRNSAEEILLDNKKSEEEYQSRKTGIFPGKPAKSSFWKRPFRKRVKT
ncbi:receptor-type tyrosine-protein phosphatase kappa [Elysia marginata]|uniref:Receptor-type tyrosine-protein phosphatase kappa n=1 Tax=Elysia marginata TaxID=1093978 RepID=A0AAV4F1N8_9GAST|nr:receptor-type tyrosine-protein phosphatase kappa [Elysia marginata]